MKVLLRKQKQSFNGAFEFKILFTINLWDIQVSRGGVITIIILCFE